MNLKRLIVFTIFILLLVAALYSAIQMAIVAPREFLTLTLILFGVAWATHTIATKEIKSSGDSNE